MIRNSIEGGEGVDSVLLSTKRSSFAPPVVHESRGVICIVGMHVLTLVIAKAFQSASPNEVIPIKWNLIAVVIFELEEWCILIPRETRFSGLSLS